MKTSTNALTARYCATKGWPCETVQSWRGRVRHDLFGVADSIVLAAGILLVQNCSYGTLKAHRDEIEANPLIDTLKSYHWQIQLWEWRKVRVGRRKLWRLRIQTWEHVLRKWCDVSEWSAPMDLYPRKA